VRIKRCGWSQRSDALKAAGQAIPEYQGIRMIVDTGATVSVVEETILQKLGLSPTGMTQILTPSTKGAPFTCATYDILLAIYHAKYPLLHTTFPVIGSDFTGQGIHGLIGCDILSQCLFQFDGVGNTFNLAF
jgi:hypothetical protein